MDFDVGGEKLCRYLPQDTNEMVTQRERREVSLGDRMMGRRDEQCSHSTLTHLLDAKRRRNSINEK